MIHMSPRALVLTIASTFVVAVAAIIVVDVWRRGATGLMHVVFVGVAVSLAVGLVRRSVVDRWATIVAASAIAVGISVNSSEQPTTEMVIPGVTLFLCATGLLTPLAGSYFAKNKRVEQDGDDRP